eukprot:GFUD01031982.1.p1 GENE.GFUD01031982.1~~GFUD01031982.1.p1  ORF type:complete len:284 (-),score=86.63 GFUD01031982.1:85-936(-)
MEESLKMEGTLKMEETLKIVCISDTHSGHRQLQLPPGDILIHSGDFSKSRTKLNAAEYIDFVQWFSAQPHETKILIAGNRDDFMHTEICHKFRKRSLEEIESVQSLFTNSNQIIYLKDSAYEYNQRGFSFKIWGSPWTRLYGKEGKAFQVSTAELKQKWALIPKDTTLLITHGPPLGICDMNLAKVQAGCPELLAMVKEIQPRIHLFGHIHEGYGTLATDQTLFINAASIDKITHKLTNEPVVLALAPDLTTQLISGGTSQPHSSAYKMAETLHPHNTGCEIV